MPYFYCHLHGPCGCERDEVGLEFSGLEAVYLDVCRAILDMSADLARSGHDPMPYAFEIVDAAGVLLMEVPFREMLSKGRPPGRHRAPLSPSALQADVVRARDLRASVAAAIADLADTMRISQALVARSRTSAAADPWVAPPRKRLSLP